MLITRRDPETLTEAIRHFADPSVSFAFVVQLRWPNGVSCPHCKAEKPGLLKTRMIWKCRKCKRQFSVKVGTIFEDSPLGLDKWLPALWLLANAKNGISSYELARSLGVTQKTAWFMLSRIRLAMQTQSFAKLSGTVEADETFIGGKIGNMHKSKKARLKKVGGASHMEAVMGMLARKRGDNHSTVRLAHIATPNKRTIDEAIRANVAPGSHINTDSLQTYEELGKFKWRDTYTHAAVNHAIQYVDGQVHTNGLENFWSLLKRSIRGTYVSVDPFHLFRYLDEQAYRFNNRGDNDFGRFAGVLRAIIGKRLTYAELISADMQPART
jgi:transposase-like protein